jgi:hypothetical protein
MTKICVGSTPLKHVLKHGPRIGNMDWGRLGCNAASDPDDGHSGGPRNVGHFQSTESADWETMKLYG